MKKIGLIDLYPDNWHTNYYPQFLRDTITDLNLDYEVKYIYIQQKSTNDIKWCAAHDMESVDTYDELIELSDALMVMCADNCLPHEQLADKALRSGKPVYCDKTFAPTYEAAVRMFNIAEQYNTPLFTCSANRYCQDIINYKTEVKEAKTRTIFCGTTGPGDNLNYSIHQYEMINTIMGNDVKRCMGYKIGSTDHIVYEYGDGRLATMTQCNGADYETFNLLVSREDGKGRRITVADYYTNLMRSLLNFFEDKIPPVNMNDTLTITAMQEIGRRALCNNGNWIYMFI